MIGNNGGGAGGGGGHSPVYGAAMSRNSYQQQGLGSVDPEEYDTYDDIFRPTAHESAISSSMPPATAAMLGGGGGGGGSSVAGSSSSPTQGHQQVSPHAQHISVTSAGGGGTGTVPDYSQYRYAGVNSMTQGYDTGIAQAVLNGGNTAAVATAANSGFSQEYYYPQQEGPGPYASQDYSSVSSGRVNDHFLRELRE
ncbi:hypothetical protein BG004_002563 [Podila humilis]|nr:hypothetical protein BG004_002563 [Podila humilis]